MPKFLRFFVPNWPDQKVSFVDSMEHLSNKPLPPINQELVDALHSRFPDRCPDITLSDREIWFQAGQRSVVNFLKHSLDKQIESRFNNVQGS